MSRLQPGVNDLLTWCQNNGEWGQQLINEWVGLDEDGNHIEMSEVSRAGRKSVVWKCSTCNNTWVALVASRTSGGNGCTECARRNVALRNSRPTEENSLVNWCRNNGDYGHRISEEFTGIDVDGNTVAISELKQASKRQVQWRCIDCGHIWYAAVHNRSYNKSGCPMCAKSSLRNRVSTEKNSLMTWCKTNGDFGKQIIDEWVGIDTDGNVVEMHEIAYRSHRKVMWKCSKCNHTWGSTIINRTSNKTGCPACRNRVATENNNLLKWCQNNEKLGKQLIDEWVGIDDEGNTVRMNELIIGSSKRIMWRCSKCKHEWYARAYHRITRKTGCPACANQVVTDTNNLEVWCSNNKEIGEQIIKQFKGIDESGNEISASSILSTSTKKVLWECEVCKHKWYASVKNRTIHKTKCPACVNQVVTDTNNLEVWCNNNGEYGKLLISEWTGLCEDGSIKSIRDVVPGNCKRFLWECADGHQWKSTVYDRTHNMTRCVKCNSVGTSYPEQFIYWSLKQLYTDAENRSKQFGFELDIYIPSINFAVEYGSDYYHKGKEIKDEYKKKKCKELNITLISVVEKKTDSNRFDGEYIEYKNGGCIETIVEYILNTIGHELNDIDIEYSKKQAYKYSGKEIIDEHRIDKLYPELYKEFNKELNSTVGIKVENISSGSQKRIYWTCIKCGYGSNGEWYSSVSNRARGAGCPNCGWNWLEQRYKQAKHKGQSKAKYSFWDALAMLADKENKE